MRARLALVFVLLLARLPAAAADDAPILLVLEAADAGNTKIEIADRPEPQLAEPPRTAAIWRLRPGAPVTQARRPADRAVDLYTGTPRALDLLGRVVIRYFPAPAGWVPHYRLDEQPVVVRINGRWQPLVLPGGAGPLVRYGGTLPNAEGFFPALEFGPAAGTLAIAGWKVH